MEAMNVRKCVYCGRRLPRLCRSNQLFCDRLCKSRALRTRKRERALASQDKTAAASERPAPVRASAALPRRGSSTPPTAQVEPAKETLSPSETRWWKEGLQRFASFEADMRQVQDATHYRLARAIKHKLRPTFVPERGKPTPRVDGRLSDEPYQLRPQFEPPHVPEAGLYAVQLLNASGAEVRLPRSLYRGVTLPKWPPEELPGASASTDPRAVALRPPA